MKYSQDERDEDRTSVRVDKWLWAARFYKTRSLAAEAVAGGKVHWNGQRIKPAKDVHLGDELRITRGNEELTVIVRALSQQRGPAKIAATLYEETAASRAAREANREMRRFTAEGMQAPAGRPSKKDRRKIIRFIRGEE